MEHEASRAPFVWPTADVDERAVLGAGTTVWHLAQVREDARLGCDCIIGRGAYVGPGVTIGDKVKLQNYALVYEPARLEDAVFIGPAAVLTNDHFPRSVDLAGNLKRPGDWDSSGVVVREGASVGARAVILPGCVIGRWAMIGRRGGDPRCARLRAGGRVPGQARRMGRPGRRAAGRNERGRLALPAVRRAVRRVGRHTPVTRRVAGVDCGTNSLRLLVADVDLDRSALTDVDRRMEIVRLGQGVDRTGRLAPEALARTAAVLREYAAIIADSGASAVRMVATSATRDADNAAEFTGLVKEELGIVPEILTGTQEAVLSFTGATAELASEDVEGPFLVVDIGGGSTEFVLARGDDPPQTPPDLGGASSPSKPPWAVSVNIGCVRMTERHLHDDPPTGQQIAAATADIDAALATVAGAVPVGQAKTLIGLAGSVTTVAGIAMGLQAYDAAVIHHARVSAADVHAVTTALLAQTRAARATIGVMHPGRVDVIGAGALVLDRIMSRFGFAEVLVSEHDILDGIAWSLATNSPR